jgi:hypothetical protein
VTDWYCYAVWSRRTFPSGLMAEVIELTFGRARINAFTDWTLVLDCW